MVPRSSPHVSAGMTAFENESEERIVKGNGDVKMQDLHGGGDGGGAQLRHQGKASIVVSKQVSVTSEDRKSEASSKESFCVV